MKLACATIGLLIAAASAFALIDSIFLGVTITIIGMVIGGWAMALGDE